MTFIASVVAKNGVAIIADSLVTTSRPILRMSKFIEFLKGKGGGSSISISPSEIADLFESQTSHTTDYEDKLFKFDKFTAITTAGSASINDKRVNELVSEYLGLANNKTRHSIKDFVKFLNENIDEHLKTYNKIGDTILIFTRFSKTNSETTITRVRVPDTDIIKVNKDYAIVNDEPTFKKVICYGQNRISDRILYGDLDAYSRSIEKIATVISSNCGMAFDDVVKLLSVENVFGGIEEMDVAISNLKRLSLQQAVDLASILMKLEMDFQRYTKDIPTVGGVVKIAKIDKDGFSFISGNDLIVPKIFNH